MSRPTFARDIGVLTLADPRLGLRPATEQIEIAAVLAEIEDHHRGAADYPDPRGRYGRCTGGCGPWPCPTWAYGEQLALQYLIRGANRIANRAAQTLTTTREHAR